MNSVCVWPCLAKPDYIDENIRFLTLSPLATHCLWVRIYTGYDGEQFAFFYLEKQQELLVRLQLNEPPHSSKLWSCWAKGCRDKNCSKPLEATDEWQAIWGPKPQPPSQPLQLPVMSRRSMSITEKQSWNPSSPSAVLHMVELPSLLWHVGSSTHHTSGIVTPASRKIADRSSIAMSHPANLIS